MNKSELTQLRQLISTKKNITLSVSTPKHAYLRVALLRDFHFSESRE